MAKPHRTQQLAGSIAWASSVAVVRNGVGAPNHVVGKSTAGSRQLLLVRGHFAGDAEAAIRAEHLSRQLSTAEGMGRTRST